MQEYIDLFLNFIAQNKAWAPPLIGMVALLESIFVIGLLMPATVILVATGALIGADALPFWPISVAASIGCFLGDNISYTIGRKVRPGLLHARIYQRYRNVILRSHLLFRKFGICAVFFGRFLGPLRSSVPTVAGVLRVPFYKFQLANFCSAVIWPPLYMLPGIAIF
ncbi:DedA family protein [Oligella urethralis]|uniref:DedA family protein n=1 Tax=Oligella urethralis TaxID=90245 RepID=UPI000C9B279C|nr:DedA family protein [Oligella urethralis]PMC16965.1 DedA family protein [Oligella urethralis]